MNLIERSGNTKSQPRSQDDLLCEGRAWKLTPLKWRELPSSRCFTTRSAIIQRDTPHTLPDRLGQNDAVAPAPHPNPLPASAGRGRSLSRHEEANHLVQRSVLATDFPLPSLARGEDQGEGSRSIVPSASLGLRRTLWIAWLATTAVLSAAGPSLSQKPAGIVAGGTPAATPYYVQDTGVAGPTVVITGGVHGDEPAGAYAAEQIRHWSIKRGKMVVLPRANVVALQAGKRLTPGEEAAQNNLNRDFRKVKENGPPRGALAKALWEFARQQKPTWFIDLHEGGDFRALTNKSVGSSIIPFPTPEGKTAAAAMLAAVNASITNQSIQFKLLGSPIDGSIARAAGAHLGAHAMILETTMKSQALSLRARQHRIMVHTLLKHLDMIDASVTPEWMTERAGVSFGSRVRQHADGGGRPDEVRTLARAATIRLAVYDATGTGGTGAARVIEQVGKQPGAIAVRVCGQDIQHGVLGQFNVVVVPGGSGSKEAAGIGEDGRDRIKKFVEAGGGYIGICAGAYLATSGFAWGLKILDAKTASPKWMRGTGMVKLELTDRGREILGDKRGQFDCKYANGPILVPAQVESLPDYEPLAFFRTELAKNDTPVGIMVNSPAIVAGRCGKGRVIVISPHPEQTPGLDDFIPRAVTWVVIGK
ncbi:MAG: hypothetical protein FJ388_06555 [Verrucomicrobia bacterium]|nr:hypothetical protein [Verrucomicrobiota bacterium]